MKQFSGFNPRAAICGGLLLLFTAWSAQAAVTITLNDGNVCTDGTVTLNAEGAVASVTAVPASCSIPPPASYMVTVSKAGTGAGTVSGAGFNCGADCTETYPDGTAPGVTLTATANAGSTFTGWSGGGCSGDGTCTLNATGTENFTVTATFTADVPTGSCGALPSNVVVIDTGNITAAWPKTTYTPAGPEKIYAFKVRLNAGETDSSTANATKDVSAPRTKTLVVSTCPGVLTPVNNQSYCVIAGTNVSTVRLTGNAGAASYYCKLPNASTTDYYVNAVSKASLTDTAYSCTSSGNCAFAFDRN